MTTMTTTTRARHPWIAFVTASILVMIGIYFFAAKLDPFLVAAVMPLAVCLAFTGAHARRHDDWPSRWPYWIVAALVAGLAIYGVELWLYDLAHPPVAV